MTFLPRAVSVISLLIFAVFPAHADDTKLFPAEVTLPNSRIIRFTSAIDKEPYTIQVGIPFSPPPKSGYPVIYVLDGEAFFPEAASVSGDEGSKEAVVVGIGHGVLNDKSVIRRYAGNDSDGKPITEQTINDAFSRLRDHDFKWPVKPEHRAPPFVLKTIGPETGDVRAFLQVIEKEIKPKVEALVPIDRGDQALFGHSAGGLAVVQALFAEPAAFRTFIAASPALWYDGGAVLDGERKFAEEVAAGRIAPRVLITSGALEPDSMRPPEEYMKTLTPAQRAEIEPYAKMRGTWPSTLSGARNLATQLKAIHGKSGYKVEYQLLAGENHQGAGRIAIARAMPFAFPTK